MELSPFLYHSLVRPKWINQFYVHNRIQKRLDLSNKRILDFGAGTGANCTLCQPGKYLGIDPDEKRITLAKKLYPYYDFDVFRDDSLCVEKDSIDVILTIAVLHHISSDKLKNYVKQFRKVLKSDGMIVAIEPCLFKKSFINNWYMKSMDNGSFIETEEFYHDLFRNEGFTCTTIQRFKKCFLYNEIFFIAK
ncbi:class I SAM-dependent methyltransferase [Bacillaceae bacterium S4-13-58]